MFASSRFLSTTIRAYEYVRSIFSSNLPHKSTLRAWYKNSNIDSAPGVCSYSMDLLKRISDDFEKSGKRLVCSLSFDEMFIRKHVEWHDSSGRYFGYTCKCNGKNADSAHNENQTQVSNQAIVFMVCGLNASFKLPVAYHFITSLKADEKKDMLNEVIEAVTKSGVHISNVTFDGFTILRTIQ